MHDNSLQGSPVSRCRLTTSPALLSVFECRFTPASRQPCAAIYSSHREEARAAAAGDELVISYSSGGGSAGASRRTIACWALQPVGGVAANECGGMCLRVWPASRPPAPLQHLRCLRCTRTGGHTFKLRAPFVFNVWTCRHIRSQHVFELWFCGGRAAGPRLVTSDPAHWRGCSCVALAGMLLWALAAVQPLRELSPQLSLA